VLVRHPRTNGGASDDDDDLHGSTGPPSLPSEATMQSELAAERAQSQKLRRVIGSLEGIVRAQQHASAASKYSTPSTTTRSTTKQQQQQQQHPTPRRSSDRSLRQHRTYPQHNPAPADEHRRAVPPATTIYASLHAESRTARQSTEEERDYESTSDNEEGGIRKMCEGSMF
jgi:hypothetical protein